MGVLRRLRARSHGRDEHGFGLLELVVASTVMMTALTSLAYVATNAFGTIGMTRERQTANALLDEAMEQLRALPYDTIWLGMRTSDLAGDPRVIGAGTSASPYRLATNNERIVHVSNNITAAPLVPNRSTRTVNNVVYTVRIYLSYYNDNVTSGIITGTAYVDWYSGVQPTDNAFVRTSTLLFATTSSASGYSHAGPKLPYFAAESHVHKGLTSVSTGGSVGLDVASPSADSEFVGAQNSKVEGWALTEAVRLPTATPPTVWGPLLGSSQANNDPGLLAPTDYDADAGSSAPPAASTVPFGSGTMTVSVGSASSYDTVATLLANGSNTCRDLAGTGLTDNLPCGRTTGAAGATNATVDLTALSGTLTGMDVLQIGATTAGVHTNRDTVSSGGGVCTGTSATGCVHTRATRTISSIHIGALPAPLRPTGFGSLVQLTGYTDTVTAEAGINASAPATSAGGDLQIWTGLGYSTIPWATAAGTTLAIPPLNVSLGTVSVSITADIRAGAASTSSTAGTCNPGSLACRTLAEATLGSPLRGTVAYDVRILGVSVMNFAVTIDMGDLIATAQYIEP